MAVTRLVAPGPDVAMQTPTLSGRHRVALGRVTGPLLVAHQDVADQLALAERIVDRKDGAAGDAEDDLDPDTLQRLHQRLGAGQQLRRVIIGHDPTFRLSNLL